MAARSKIVRSSVCPKSLVEVVEYVEEPPARDEAGLDERPDPRDSTGETVHPSVRPELAMEAGESAEGPPDWDEPGFDEGPGPRDSTGESVHPSACPEWSMDVDESADEPRRRKRRRTQARGEHPVGRLGYARATYEVALRKGELPGESS